MPDRIEMLVIVPGGEWHERQVGTLNLSSLCQVKYPRRKRCQKCPCANRIPRQCSIFAHLYYMQLYITRDETGEGGMDGCLLRAKRALLPYVLNSSLSMARVAIAVELGNIC